MTRQGCVFTEQEVKRIMLLLADTDMSMRDIAKRMQCSCSAVAAINRKSKVRQYGGLRSTWQTAKLDRQPVPQVGEPG